MAACAEFGTDITKQLVPVAPAAHYLMGGIAADLQGRTTMRGLYACGECACCGIHGANRLASNSLLEGLVYGDRCAEAMLDQPARDGGRALHLAAPPDSGPVGDRELRRQVQDAMWQQVGIIRSAAPLEQARRTLEAALHRPEPPRDRVDWEVGNMALVGFVTAIAAATRTESRGAHFREDFPERRDPEWRRHLVLQRGSGGGVRLTYLPVADGPEAGGSTQTCPLKGSGADVVAG